MAALRIRLGVLWAGLLVGGSAASGQTSPPGPGTPLPPPPSSATSVTVGSASVVGPVASGVGGALATLTSPRGPEGATLPPGSVSSPWCGDQPAGAGCCGPIGANGPLTYELYVRTG